LTEDFNFMHVLNNFDSLWYFIPESVLTVVFTLIFLLDLPKGLANRPRFSAGLASIGLLLYIAATIYSYGFPIAVVFPGMIIVDPFTNFFRIFCAATALVAIYLSLQSKEVANARAEYWALLVGIAVGMPMLAASNNLLMIYLSMELVSILSYVLVGYIQGSRH